MRLRGSISAGLLLLLLGAPAQADTPKPPRLTGTVVSANDRLAVFADDTDANWSVAREGDIDAGYRVRSIAPDLVIVVGPEGVLTLHVQERADHSLPTEPVEPRPTPAEQGATALGMSAGIAAARYDICARRDLLASTPGTSALSRVQAVVTAMARLPPIPDPNGTGVPQPGALAEWIRKGAETALGRKTDVRDRADCELAARAWDTVAGRLGAR